MSLMLRNGHSSRYLARDPFSLFFGDRPTTAFAPAFEVKETPDAYIVKADVPGIAEGDLEIAVHNNVLTVSGSRTAEERKDGEAYSLYERQFGSFTRSFQLPELADGEKIEAKLVNGVLALTIAKKAEAKPRKIALSK